MLSSIRFDPATGSRLVISLRRNAVDQTDREQQAGTTATGDHSNQQQGRQRVAESEGQRNRSQQRQVQPVDDDVIVLDSASDSDSDSDVMIVGVTQRKRPRLVAQQPSVQVIQSGVAIPKVGPAMPTWEQPAAPVSPPSPEPAFKCLICLEGIKSDNMATTPCG